MSDHIRRRPGWWGPCVPGQARAASAGTRWVRSWRRHTSYAGRPGSAATETTSLASRAASATDRSPNAHMATSLRSDTYPAWLRALAANAAPGQDHRGAVRRSGGSRPGRSACYPRRRSPRGQPRSTAGGAPNPARSTWQPPCRYDIFRRIRRRLYRPGRPGVRPLLRCAPSEKACRYGGEMRLPHTCLRKEKGAPLTGAIDDAVIGRHIR